MKLIKTFLKSLGHFFDLPWYPLAISAYPVLALLASNLGQVNAEAVTRPLLISAAFGILLYLVLWLFLHQLHKAAFLTSLLLTLFFTYGHAYIYLDEKFPDANYTTWLAAGYILLLILAIVWTTRPKLTFASAAAIMNTIALALLVMSLWNIRPQVKAGGVVHTLGAKNAPVESDLRLPENPPDVYFFLLDSYARGDFLQTVYDYDNGEFLNDLRERGFYVADCSMANYIRTELSLGSSLNMSYLQGLDPKFVPDNIGRLTLWDSLQHSAVRYNFENLGYQTVNFATGFAWLELTDADHFYLPPPLFSGMSEFEGLFLRTTAGRYAENWGWINEDAVMAQEYRDRFNLVFNSMAGLAKMPGAKFVYAHLIAPHPPFVFDPNGKPTDPSVYWNAQRLYPADLYQQGYLNELPYLNKKILAAVDTLISKSKSPPIIIIQGDHGPWLQPNERHLEILNAYYLPGHNDQLYPAITPVNSFRIIFDAYFGGKYDTLKDVSYYSPVPNLYDFSEVPNTCGDK